MPHGAALSEPPAGQGVSSKSGNNGLRGLRELEAGSVPASPGRPTALCVQRRLGPGSGGDAGLTPHLGPAPAPTAGAPRGSGWVVGGL